MSNKYTEDILFYICDNLQLQPSLYELAEKRYKTIAEILQKDDAFENIDLKIYPQGSFRLKTTVKPLSSNEYDLDFVVEIPNTMQMTPEVLYNHIYRILSNDGIHNDKVEKKSRCIRIAYANDFHMDIMPGQSVGHGTEIIVPDHDLKKGWGHHSNPIAYANWFEAQAKTAIIEYMSRIRKYAASTEPVTDQEVTERLEPLRRAVQLIKRYRDIYCDGNNKEPVRSIVICTLMGYISSSYSNTLDIISDFCSYVNAKIGNDDTHPFEVKNPVVDEVLTEKWTEDTQNYKDFVAMMKSLTADVQELCSASINTDITTLTKKMFGETVTEYAVKKNAEKTDAARRAGTLGVTGAGVLTTATKATAATVKGNTFFGGINSDGIK